MAPYRGQGAFEYILMLSGVLLVVITIIYMMQGSVTQADSTLDAQMKAAGVALDISYYLPGAKPQFMPNSPADGAGSTARPNISALITVKDAQLYEVKYNWNGINHTMYDQSLLLGLNMENNPSLGDSAQQVMDISQRGINGRVYANTLLLTHLDTNTGGTTSNNGTCYNMNDASGASECNWVAGKSGSAIQFDGINDYVDYGNALSQGKTTITLWFKSNSTKQHNGLIYFVPGNSRGHFDFNYDGTGQPILYLAKYNYAYFNATASTYFDGKWHFLALYIHGAAMADLNSATLSIDLKNISMTSIRATAAPLAWTGLNIGKSYYGGFNGTIDEIAVYNRALSAAELQRLYNAGTANNTNTDPNAKWGSALNFDGVNDYVSVPDRPEWDFGYNNFSISFWFKKYGSNRQHALSIGSTSNNNIMFDFDDGTYGVWAYWMGSGSPCVRTTNRYNDGKWHHLTLSRGGNLFTLYLDGRNTTTATVSSNIQISGPTVIGMQNSNYWWNGSIDEIRVWNRTLASAEVEMHYNSNLYKYTPNVWFFDYRNESLAPGTYNYTVYASGGYKKDGATPTRTVKYCQLPWPC